MGSSHWAGCTAGETDGGLAQDNAQAVALYVMAAQQGLDGAQYELGDMR